MTTELVLRFPITLPGGTIDRVTIDLDRPRLGIFEDDMAAIAHLAGMPPAVVRDMAEFDYVRILLKIDELNEPRLKGKAV